MPTQTTYPGVYVQEKPHGPRSITGVATSITAFIGAATGGPVNEAVSIHGFADFATSFGGLSRSCPMSYAVHQFFQSGGMDALIVRVGGSSNSVTDADVIGDRAAMTGIYALTKDKPFNLLCIPPLDFDTDPNPRTLDSALDYCVERRAMLIVDPPQTWLTKDDVKAGVGSLLAPHCNAAVYFPRLQLPDPLEGDQRRMFAPCGAVCGVMARTDAELGVWKSPAGLRASLPGVNELACELSDSDLSELNSLAVNCLRTLPVAGAVIWGARTMEGIGDRSSEWKYVPIRRLGLFIEESICRGIEWAVHEPNDDALWLQLNTSINAFMFCLFKGGALQGPKSDDAFFVKCDRTTTTQADIDSGNVNIVVGFAPLKPSEFIILRFRQKTGSL